MRKFLFRSLCLFFALLALTALFPAYFFAPLWMVRILVTELGHWFGLAGLLVALLCYRTTDKKDQMFYKVLLVSTIFLFRPVLSAWWNFDAKVKDIPWSSLVRPVYSPQMQPKTLSFEREGAKLPVDFYSVPGKPSRGLVIVIHGGSWAKGSRMDLPELNEVLADAGFAVAAVSYRFAPMYHFPVAVQDVLAATDYLVAQSKELGFSTKNIFFVGRSAGGQIAEIAASRLLKRGTPQGMVRGVVTFYAPADLEWGYNVTRPYHIIDGHAVIGDYLNGTPSEIPSTYSIASPLFQVDKLSPPHLLIHGAWDELVAFHHTEVLSEKLRSLGRPVTVLELAWATHGFDYFPYGPGGLVAFTAVKNFLAENSN